MLEYVFFFVFNDTEAAPFHLVLYQSGPLDGRA